MTLIAQHIEPTIAEAQQPSSTRPNNPYVEQAIMTASPSALVVKLYEGAIMNLRKVIQAIDDGDVKERWRSNRKAFDIIEHLMLTLNEEKGGEIAGNLIQLYRHMMIRLLDVDVKNDRAAAEEVIVLLQPLHKAWSELDHRLTSEAARQGQPAQDASSNASESREADRVYSTA